MSSTNLTALLDQLDPEARAAIAGTPVESSEAELRYLVGISPAHQSQCVRLAARFGGTIGTDIRIDEPRRLAAEGTLPGLELPEPVAADPWTDQSPATTAVVEPPAAEPRFPDYPYHPAADIFPLMTERELNALAADIKQNGLLEDIWLLDGRIVDGRHRYLACRIAGVEPRFREWHGAGSLVAWIVSVNLHRRHLTDQQRALVAARAKEAFAAEAKERSLANLLNQKGSLDARDPGHREAGRSASRAAEALNVSTDSVERAARLLKRGDETLVAAVQNGEVSLTAAAAVVTLPKKQQRKLVAKGEVKAAAKTIRMEKKASRKDPPSAATEEPPATAAEPEPKPPASPAPMPSASPPKLPVQIPHKIRFADAFLVVTRVIRKNGDDFARKVIDKVAAEAAFDVWISTNDIREDLSGLAKRVRSRLDDLAEADPEDAQDWLRSHIDDLQELLRAIAPDDEDYASE